MASGGQRVRFEDDIKPLFREEDQQAMEFLFDLWDYEDVADNAPEILAQLEAGTMPCDGAWPAEQVALFRRWAEGGLAR